MKIIIALLFAISQCSFADTLYVKIGAGYKLEETTIYNINTDNEPMNDPVTARFEVGIKDDNLFYGIAHRSQWFKGAPINGDSEYFVTEFFIDYQVDWEF